MTHLLDSGMNVLGMQAMVLQTANEQVSPTTHYLPQEQHSIVRADLIVDDDITDLQAYVANKRKNWIPPLRRSVKNFKAWMYEARRPPLTCKTL